MIQDDVIWKIIKYSQWAFKTKTETQDFCRNKYNLTGLCTRQACPLSNAKYSTILEEKGVCYLYQKTIKRAHLPERLWHRIKLPKNYKKALEIIDQELEFDSKFQRHKSKQRLTKLHQMIIRRRRLKLNQIEKFEPIKTKFEKREKIRESKAEKAANLEISIEKELLNRLKEGVYPKEIYNIDQNEFEKAIAEQEIEDEQEYEVDEESDLDSEESEDEVEHEIVEADIDEVDDLEDVDELLAEGDDEDVPDRRGKEKMVEIEYEVDDQQQTY